MRQGYTLVWCGWQHDVPDVKGLLRLTVPDACTSDGPISGDIAVTFQPRQSSRVQLLADRLHRPYRAAVVTDRNATLTMREHGNAAPQAIPRDQWCFARLKGGAVVPDDTHIYMASGFVPGRVYQVIYPTTGAPVVGLGLAATRDMVSFLRYGVAPEGNPCASDIERAYGFGASQSGRFLRQFLYLGLNEDEAGRTVFDGVMPHIAGSGRGEFNQRFGQPSSIAKQSMGNLFPFTDTVQTEPQSGRSEGLLSRLASRDAVPRMFFTNTSAEYWRGDAALIHTTLDGTTDVQPSDAVRIYHYAGTQHSSGLLPLTDVNPTDGARAQHVFNCVDYTPLLRAALVRLDRWVSTGEEPPPSCHPRLADGTAVPPEQVKSVFMAVPGLGFPAHVPHVPHLDFGPHAASGVTTLPPQEGAAYPLLVPDVNADGNERGGIGLPDIRVPLATYTGWNLRHPEIGAPEYLIGLLGATLPFAATRAEQAAAGDPRLAIELRYASKADYLDRVKQAAQQLIDEGFLLDEDLSTVLAQAAERYDLFCQTVPRLSVPKTQVG
jgi:hypothetical protein